MRILFHTINGVGLGHLVRLSWIARAVRLRQPDGQQLMVSSSAFAADYFDGPSYQIPCDLLDRAGHQSLFEDHVREYLPDVMVFDTRWPNNLPALVALRNVRVILVLRALAADRMRTAVLQASTCFDHILLPHTQDELRFYYESDRELLDLLSRPPFRAIGPVARVNSVRSEHGAVFFTLGAGAPYLTPVAPSDEVAIQLDTFLRAGAILSEHGYHDLRLLAGPFLEVSRDCGPFRLIRDAAAHELLGPGCSVVNRGGYNSCWEAIGAGSSLVVSSSQRLVEDVQARCRYISNCGWAWNVENTPSAIARGVMLGPPPNLAEGVKTTNRRLADVVDAIVN